MSSTEAPPTASRPRTARSAKAAKAAKAPPPTKAIEMLDALKAASRDKEIELDRLVSALEEAVATAARKVYKVREITARFDPETGGLTAWTPYRIVEQKTKPEVTAVPEMDPDDIPIGYVPPPPPAAVTDSEKEIRLPWIELLPEEIPGLLSGELAGQSWQVVRDPDGEAVAVSHDEAGIGDEIRFFRSTEGLGRIAAQSAKQVLYQKVREAERDNIYNEYAPKLGELITGTVKRFERGDMIVDLGRTEAVIPREHQSRAERYTQGERVRGVLVDVHRNPKGAQVVLSRTAPELLMRLMEMEVPEIYDGTVVIRGCVRQPGDRAKVAVSSRERDVDPVGACVGMRGARVQAITRELRGERIDIIQFSEDVIAYAQNALSPAKITRVSLMNAEEGVEEEGEETMPTLECIVEEDQLSLAIGKRGQNVRLASALIGAKIDIKSEQAVKEQVAQALQRMLLASQRRGTALAEILELEPAALEALAAAGFETVGEVLEADGGEDEEASGRLDAALPDEDDRLDALDALRAFESAPAEEEPEEEEGDFLTTDEDGEEAETEETGETEETSEAEGSEEAGDAGAEDATGETASEPGDSGPETENPEK
ncbi:MAG: transcription termination factor NusA [Holophagales bacterium]|nr:transcription termination factor NusA [Holophagales bacterium]